MTGIVDFAVKQWRMTLAFLFFSVIGGLAAMFTVQLDAQPDVAVPFITVQVTLPGISPEDSERTLVKPLEKELKSLDGLKQMDSTAATSVGVVVLEFEANFDQESAIADVLEAVDKARGELPAEAKEPVVEELNTSTMPIIVVNLFGNAPARELQLRAKELQARLEASPKILEAVIQGERENLLEAIVDPSLMESYGITFNALAAAISRNNSLVAAGDLATKTGEFAIKFPGLIEKPDDLANIVIRTDQDGSIIRMRDIAEIRKTYKDSKSYATFQGRPSVSLEVSKRLGENIIETIEDVRRISNQTSASWPTTVNVELSQDRTQNILDLLRSLLAAIINAVILVFIVCVAAIGLRSALMIGVAIPSSFLITIFLFNVQGITINMIVMFSMVLSVGILVDSAIVIIEYADRKLAEGLPRKQAYVLAGKRMFWPIITSTATTLAAFVPLLFWNTTPGQFMSYFPRTLVYVLTASLLMALVFLPTLGALFGPRKHENASESLKNLSATGGDPLALEGFTGNYARVVNTLARRPLAVLLVLFALVFGIFKWFAATPHTVEFFTEETGDAIYVYARARGNISVLDEYEIGRQIEARLQGIEGMKSIFTIAGKGASGSSMSNGPQSIPMDTVARTFIELLPFEERRPTRKIEADVRAAVANMPGLMVDIFVLENGPPVGKAIGIEMTSENLESLTAATEKIYTHIKTIPGLVDIENTMPLPGIDWQLDVDRAEAGRLGLDVSTIGAAVQFVTEGSLVGFYRPLNVEEEVDIRIRYPQSARDLSELDNLRVLTPNGALPLSSVVKRSAKPRQDSISRRDQMRVYDIRANTAPGYAANQIVAVLKDWIAVQDDFPADVNISFLGQDEETREAGKFFIKAAIAMLFMMGVILLWQFNSFWHVLLTLSAVVFSFAGVLLGLQFYPFISTVLCGVGVLALAGIVVNNNIVLIDTFQRLMKEGLSAHDAAVRTAAQRMRPVILTTVTTIVGLMPMVFGIQADIFTGYYSPEGSATSPIWKPISYVLVCGLGFATLLTLILTPVMLAAPALWGQTLKRYGRWIRERLGLLHNDGDGEEINGEGLEPAE